MIYFQEGFPSFEKYPGYSFHRNGGEGFLQEGERENGRKARQGFQGARLPAGGAGAHGRHGGGEGAGGPVQGAPDLCGGGVRHWHVQHGLPFLWAGVQPGYRGIPHCRGAPGFPGSLPGPLERRPSGETGGPASVPGLWDGGRPGDDLLCPPLLSGGGRSGLCPGAHAGPRPGGGIFQRCLSLPRLLRGAGEYGPHCPFPSVRSPLKAGHGAFYRRLGDFPVPGGVRRSTHGSRVCASHPGGSPVFHPGLGSGRGGAWCHSWHPGVSAVFSPAVPPARRRHRAPALQKLSRPEEQRENPAASAEDHFAGRPGLGCLQRGGTH